MTKILANKPEPSVPRTKFDQKYNSKRLSKFKLVVQSGVTVDADTEYYSAELRR